jgi:L-arabinose isomerase
MIDDEVIGRAATAGLMIRKWIQDAELDGFTINFKDIDKSSRMPCMPFFEISQQISWGIGYAGEGDVITAALAGTLARHFPEVSFVEMFCPDWQNGRVLLSHMGEANISLFKDPPLLTPMDFLYTDVGSTVAAFGCFKPGRAAMVNLAPLSGGLFRLIISEGCMVDPGGEDRLTASVRGWFQPTMPLQEYLAAFSRQGGTHHSVLVYGDCRKHVSDFGEMMGWEVACL